MKELIQRIIVVIIVPFHSDYSKVKTVVIIVLPLYFPLPFSRNIPLTMTKNYRILSKNRVNFHSIFTPWVLTSVITSFGVNIGWTRRVSTRWVVNFRSPGVRIERNSLLKLTSEISSPHRWSELFTRLFWEYRNLRKNRFSIKKCRELVTSFEICY